MAQTPDDPKMRAYEAVRAHELMLNEAVSRFEHARLAPLIALNGGAVVAFLTLLGTLLGKDTGRHPNLWLSALAVGAWVVGLLAAALATTAATGQQRAISAAHRLLREELESTLIKDAATMKILEGPPPNMKRPSSGDSTRSARNPLAGIREWWTGRSRDQPKGDKSAMPAGKDVARDRLKERIELRAIGNIYAKRLKARWWLSVAMFVTGGVLALAAIVSGAPETSVTRNTATTPKAARTQLRHPGTADRVPRTTSGEYVMSSSNAFGKSSQP